MGITTGIVPAAAVVGMLLGFGVRAGAPASAFHALGALFAGAGAFVGGVLAVALMLVCGVLYVVLVARERQHWLAWAIAIGAGAAAVLLVLARLRGGGFALVLPIGNLIEIGVVIAIALPIGMRFALPRV
jgi:hypothetical protein